MDDFEKEFERKWKSYEHKIGSIYTKRNRISCFVLGVLLFSSMSIAMALIWVAVHFIVKWW